MKKHTKNYAERREYERKLELASNLIIAYPKVESKFSGDKVRFIQLVDILKLKHRLE